jgi:hypothetical protein
MVIPAEITADVEAGPAVSWRWRHGWSFDRQVGRENGRGENRGRGSSRYEFCFHELLPLLD